MTPWNKSARSRSCVFVSTKSAVCRFLLVERRPLAPRIQAAGSFDVEEGVPLAEQLRDQLAARGVRCRQAVLLLPRSEFEMTSHHLPPASEVELPELVHNAAAAEFDEAAGGYLSDFLVTHQDYSGCDALVFSLRDERIQNELSEFKSAGMRLVGITFSGLGSVKLLDEGIQHPASTAVTVVVGDSDIELAVTESGRPILFRAIPGTPEDDRVRAERLGAEIRRTLVLAHRGDDEAVRLYLIGDVDQHEHLAQLLAEQLAVTASLVNPLNHVDLATEIESPSRFANLIGVACAWNSGGLDIDLLDPRRAPPQAGPWRRVVFWGAIAAAVLVGVGFVAWQDHNDEMGAISEQKQKLKRLAGRASRALQTQDVADAVSAWRGDEITWLDQLRELSERLPGGEQLQIRRMSLSTDALGSGVIDIAVQVSEPKVVTDLENALRDERHSVSSKRVTESDEKANLPWTFETHIAFQPDDPPQLSPAEDTPRTAERSAESPADIADAPPDRQSGGAQP